MIASHNTMTYLEPTKWWMKLFKLVYKCQDLTIEEQYDLGVRYFDFRITFDEFDYPIFAHGIVKFKTPSVLAILTKLSKKGGCYIRIVLEERKETDNTFLHSNWFRDYINYLVELFPNITFFEGTRKYDWKELCKNFISPTPKYIQRIASMTGKWFNFWCPRLYAKMNNKKTVKEYKDSDTIVFIDFIGKYYV